MVLVQREFEPFFCLNHLYFTYFTFFPLRKQMTQNIGFILLPSYHLDLLNEIDLQNHQNDNVTKYYSSSMYNIIRLNFPISIAVDILQVLMNICFNPVIIFL